MKAADAIEENLATAQDCFSTGKRAYVAGDKIANEEGFEEIEDDDEDEDEDDDVESDLDDDDDDLEPEGP